MNTMMLPFMTALILGKNKKLTNQESVRAGVMGYVGSAMPGNAGAMLGTMSAVNEGALKNKVKAAEEARETAESGKNAAEADLSTLFKNMTVEEKETFTAKNDEVKKVIERWSPKVDSVDSQTEVFASFAKIVSDLADKVNAIQVAGTSVGTSGGSLPASAAAPVATAPVATAPAATTSATVPPASTKP